MDVSSDSLDDGYAGRIEVLEGESGRHMRGEAEHAWIAADSMAPGTKVIDFARRHAVTCWQVQVGSKKLMAGVLALSAEAADELMFAALVVEPRSARSAPISKLRGGATKPSKMEMVVDGVTLRVVSGIDAAQLTRMIRPIRATSQ